ncbi:MAG: HEPN domain-containing protein [Verrucomicrobia bacterium]|nr:HEPN domain-containing protein [Verrucomicrobiota bacterium]
MASHKIPGTFWEDHCYHAQQCVEKALKAMILYHQTSFPYTHDLAKLFGLLHGLCEIPNGLEEAVILTGYAVEGRYPGFDEPLTESDWQEAVRLAESVLLWSESCIRPAD